MSCITKPRSVTKKVVDQTVKNKIIRFKPVTQRLVNLEQNNLLRGELVLAHWYAVNELHSAPQPMELVAFVHMHGSVCWSWSLSNIRPRL